MREFLPECALAKHGVLRPQLLRKKLNDIVFNPQAARFGPGNQFIRDLDRDFHKKILTRIGATGRPRCRFSTKGFWFCCTNRALFGGRRLTGIN